MWRAITFLAAALTSITLAACNAPVAEPRPLSGEAIAFGAGAGGAGDACFTCHGLKGEGDGPTPRLAGLSSSYMLKQLKDYAGHWRDDETMTPISARLSDPDRLAVSNYYASLPSLRVANRPTSGNSLFTAGDAARGLAPCAACHVPGGSDFGVATPILAGQPAVYTRDQLIAWKESRRRNDARDVMGAIARKLTLKEIERLARHIEAMP